jgi:hypothetical protein
VRYGIADIRTTIIGAFVHRTGIQVIDRLTPASRAA